MLGKLAENQIDDLLKSQYIAHLGCHADNITYVVPINYVYDDKSFYAHSGRGTKIDMMRKNPDVCIEVEIVEDIVNWQSVICWGKFEEITELEEKQLVMQKLTDTIMPLLKNDNGHPSHGITESASDIGDTIDLILYKIVVDMKSGRFEKNAAGH